MLKFFCLVPNFLQYPKNQTQSTTFWWLWNFPHMKQICKGVWLIDKWSVKYNFVYELLRALATSLETMGSDVLLLLWVTLFLMWVYAGQCRSICSKDSDTAVQVAEGQHWLPLSDHLLDSSLVLYLPLSILLWITALKISYGSNLSHIHVIFKAYISFIQMLFESYSR